MSQFKPENLNTVETIGCIEKYSSQFAGDQIRQDFIEKLCKSNLVDPTTSLFPKMNIGQKL